MFKDDLRVIKFKKFYFFLDSAKNALTHPLGMTIFLGVFAIFLTALFFYFPINLIHFIILSVFAILIYILIYYCIFFKLIYPENKFYFFRFNNNDFVSSPCLIINQDMDSRFSFELDWTGSIKEIEKRREFSLIIEKDKTIQISSPSLNREFHQDQRDFHDKKFYCLEQDYEQGSYSSSYNLYFNCEGAENVNEIKIYFEFGRKIDEISNENYHPTNLIFKETVFISKYK